MTDEYPMYLITESKEQINLVLTHLKQLEFIPDKTDEHEKGWQFWFTFDLKDKQIDLSLTGRKAYLEEYSYDLENYDSSAFFDLFYSVDAERLRYP
jgi:hypothetical protein